MKVQLQGQQQQQSAAAAALPLRSSRQRNASSENSLVHYEMPTGQRLPPAPTEPRQEESINDTESASVVFNIPPTGPLRDRRRPPTEHDHDRAN